MCVCVCVCVTLGCFFIEDTIEKFRLLISKTYMQLTRNSPDLLAKAACCDDMVMFTVRGLTLVWQGLQFQNLFPYILRINL